MMANPLLTPLIPWFNRTPSPPFLVLCFNSACGSFRSTQNLCRVVFDSLHGQLQQVHQAGDITSPKLLTDHFPPSSGAFSLTIPSEHPWPSWDQMPELYRKPLSSILSRKCFHLDVLEGDDSSRSSILVGTALLGQVWEAPSTEGPCLHHHHPHYCHPGPGVTCSTWSIFDRQGYLGEALLNGFSYGNPKELWGLDSSSCSPGLQQLFVTLCHSLSPFVTLCFLQCHCSCCTVGSAVVIHGFIWDLSNFSPTGQRFLTPKGSRIRAWEARDEKQEKKQ